MSIYIPNISEIAVLKSILLQRAMTIGLLVCNLNRDDHRGRVCLVEGAGYLQNF
mgnify:CR=1 FL=1